MSGLIAPVTTVELVLRLARSYRWVREKGQNRGEAVRHLLKLVGLAEGQPWCAAFVAKIGYSAFGDDWPLPMVGGCATLGEAAHKKGMLMKYPAPGSIFLMYFPSKGRYAHTGFVDHPTADGWMTIEENTGPGSPDEDGEKTREGDGVYQRERDFSDRDRFIYWWATAENR